MVRLDHGRARSVSSLHVVGEAVVHARIDVELADAPCGELALHRREERPDKTLPSVGGIDQHVQKGDAARGPRRSGHREPDKGRPVRRRHHDGIAIRCLPPHLALGEGA
jgi:hypothetical protein